MENKLAPYEMQFSNDDRKRIIGHTLQELRKSHNYAQKEVAGFINVKPTTYNTYETGRTEPPAEILVRLSYLYDISLDIIMQRERLYRTADDMKGLLKQYKKDLDEIEKQGDITDPNLIAFKNGLYEMLEQVTLLNEQEITKKAINSDVTEE